ncbi:hypothetical protein P0L94_00945 [Microbacter sp. GSS18]|nr:hypothetical protein P0L94_00945 [Microbacter sp. GSS18]
MFDTYILSTAPWKNPSAWQHKIEWVHLHLGDEETSPAWKRLILSHHKNLNHGDFLIDDRLHNGAGEFEGELIRFGHAQFKTWEQVTDYLLPLADANWPDAASRVPVAELPLDERLAQVERASAIATIAHRCQKDKLGVPYIEHPKAVAAQFDTDTQTVEHCAGWLHDVLEDTILSPQALLDAGIHSEIVEVVELLTRRAPDEEAYYARIRDDEVARRVKYAHITHNAQPDRVAQLREDDREKLATKYEHALDILGLPSPWASSD